MVHPIMLGQLRSRVLVVLANSTPKPILARVVLGVGAQRRFAAKLGRTPRAIVPFVVRGAKVNAFSVRTEFGLFGERAAAFAALERPFIGVRAAKVNFKHGGASVGAFA